MDRVYVGAGGSGTTRTQDKLSIYLLTWVDRVYVGAGGSGTTGTQDPLTKWNVKVTL